ncbi:MAG: hypothetical protein QN142_00870 [Armatimonadota bacterium]|nr:hypothetical protein [Armatimonadota bacterium]MDR7410347.1 hypothetical protein [Armatimonadota bacterium]
MSRGTFTLPGALALRCWPSIHAQLPSERPKGATGVQWACGLKAPKPAVV